MKPISIVQLGLSSKTLGCAILLAAALSNSVFAPDQASAQGAGGDGRAACQRHFADPNVRSKLPWDCACVGPFLTERFSAEDTDFVVQIFAAGAIQDSAKIQALRSSAGPERMQKILSRFNGKFADLGAEIDKACPTG